MLLGWVAALGVVGLVALVWLIWGPPPGAVPVEDRGVYRGIWPSMVANLGGAASNLAPNGMHRHDAHVMAVGYVVMWDLYLSDRRGLSRFEREIVATAVSTSNTCHFCVGIHGQLVASRTPGLPELIRGGRIDEIDDVRHRTLARFGHTTKDPDSEALRPTTLSRQEIADAIGTAVAFHYLNRVVDAVGPPAGRARDLMVHPPAPLAAIGMKMNRPLKPRMVLGLLETKDLTAPIEIEAADHADILRWTLGDPEIADPMIYAWSTLRRQAREMYDAEVLDTIRGHLAAWNGEDTPLFDPWVDDAVAHLAHNPWNQALARQGLMVARESFRIDRRALNAATGNDPRRRLILVSYSACAAALRIARWMPMPA